MVEGGGVVVVVDGGADVVVVDGAPVEEGADVVDAVVEAAGLDDVLVEVSETLPEVVTEVTTVLPNGIVVATTTSSAPDVVGADEVEATGSCGWVTSAVTIETARPAIHTESSVAASHATKPTLDMASDCHFG